MSQPADDTASKRITGEQYHACAAAVLGYSFDGVCLLGLSLAQIHFVREWGITLAQAGAIATATLIGQCFSGYIFGPLADRYGRKPGFIACVAFFGTATISCGFAQDATQLMILRFVAGLALGAQWALSATIMAEFLPPSHRGRGNALMQAGWPLGFLIALACQTWLVPLYGWRALFFAGGASLLVAAYAWWFLAESPMWLRVKEEERAGITPARKTGAIWGDLLRGRNLRVTALGVGIIACLLSAYWVVGSWLPQLLVDERGMSAATMAAFLLWQNGSSVVGSGAGGWLGDRIGRRYLLIGSMSTTAVLFFGWMSTTDRTLFYALGIVTSFSSSVMWSNLAVFLAEQYSTAIRASALAMIYATGRIVTTFFPWLIGTLAMRTSLTFGFMLISGLYALGAVFVYALKGRGDAGPGGVPATLSGE